MDAYEDLALPAGTLKAFRISYETEVVNPLRQRQGSSLARTSFTAWYAPEARRIVAVASRHVPVLTFKLVSLDRPEPLAVALHGVVLSGLKPGAKVAVLGAGPIGLAVAFWARRMGAAQVIVTDLNRNHEQRALEMGATGFVAGAEGVVEAVDRKLGGKADIVFECVGLPGLIAQAVEHVKVKGTIAVLGLCTRPDSWVPFVGLSKEVRIQTSAFFTLPEYQAALDALNAGAAEPRHLITDTIPLDAVPETFEALKKRTHQCKVLIAP